MKQKYHQIISLDKINNKNGLRLMKIIKEFKFDEMTTNNNEHKNTQEKKSYYNLI